jgi:cadmium resistance protein CadD (predicted permease)
LTEFISTISLAVVLFASTNLDDIFILMMFFADKSLSARQIVLGQYLGIALIVGISALGTLAALLFPPTVIGLMGFLPIAIGLKKLWDLRKEAHKSEELDQAEKTASVSNGYGRAITVAAITFSNGGDNIGVYVPVFATSTLTATATLIAVFAVMVAIWCGAAYLLVNNRYIGVFIQRVGNILLPFVLIGLGIYILAEAFFLTH